MRSRNIKPGFFLNSKLADVPPIGRLLFQGLWCMADRAGRLEDDVRKIKVSVIPYDALDESGTSTMLNQLQTSGFILRYESKGNRYIQIINFEKHQYPHIKESPSTIPAPYKHRSKTISARLNPESPILNPESLSPPTPSRGADIEIWFRKIWEAYPPERRRGRKVAWRHFQANVKDLATAKRCARSLEAYLATKEVKNGYLMNASRFFNEWEDHEVERRSDESYVERSGEGISHASAEAGGIAKNPRSGGLVQAERVLASTANHIRAGPPDKSGKDSGGG